MLACLLPVMSDQMAILMSSACHAMPAQQMVSIRECCLLQSIGKSKPCMCCGSIHDSDIPLPILELANPRKHHISCQSAELQGSVNCHSQQQHDESLQLELLHRVADVLCCHTLLWHSGCIQPVSSKLPNVKTARDLLHTWSGQYM